MPRKARITVPGAVHHVMSRGIEGCRIFRDENDRSLFKGLLEKYLVKSGYLLYAWCLMDNHYHLILRINEYPLGEFMRLINGVYAQYFRKETKNRGYLFQDRYKSIVTQDQHYIEEMVRYVHLNPSRAGICKDLDELNQYNWCGHSVVMGERKWDAQNVKDLLLRFDKNMIKARMMYLDFLRDGINTEPDIYKMIRASNSDKEDFHSTASWVIGNREFVAAAIEKSKIQKQSVLIGNARYKTIDEIAMQICKSYGVSTIEVRKKSRNNLRSIVRKRICYVANREYQVAVGEIARFFGITSPAVLKKPTHLDQFR